MIFKPNVGKYSIHIEHMGFFTMNLPFQVRTPLVSGFVCCFCLSFAGSTRSWTILRMRFDKPLRVQYRPGAGKKQQKKLVLDVDVSKNRGTPKWMVYFMENPIKIDDLGVPLFLETPMWALRYKPGWVGALPWTDFHRDHSPPFVKIHQL